MPDPPVAVDRLERWDDDPAMRRAAWTAVCVASASIFLFVVDSGLMSLSLPEIEHEFPRSARSTVAWVAGGFLIAQAALLLIAGRIGDRRGRRRFYLVGLTVFSLGALATAVAPSMATIIAARIGQGVGAAFLTSGALALVLPMFPRRKAPMVIGVWGGVGSAAGWLTPTAGALLVDVNWRLGFAVVAPLGLLVCAVGRRVLPDPPGDGGRGPTDRIGLVLGPAALGMLMLALSRGGTWGWGSAATVGLAGVAIVLLAVFAVRCTRVETPLVDPSILATRDFFANVSAGFLQQIGYYSWFIVAALVMTGVWGWSVRDAGFAIALSQVPASVGAPVGGRLAVRYGHTPPIVWSALLTAGGGLWMLLTTGPEPDFWGSWLPAAVLLGFGGGICGTMTSGAALSALPAAMLGAGNSLQQLIRRVGSAVGVALGVALLGEGKGPALLAGSKRVWTLSMLAHLAMCVPLLWARRLSRASAAGRGSGRAVTAAVDIA